MKISLDQIVPSPNPVRKSWDEEKMEELAQSIREQGLIVPIKVRPDNGAYEIVYGHRRVEACKRAGLTEIEAIMEEVDDTEAQWQALIENLQREDLRPVDKASAIKERQEKGYSIPEISRRTGNSISRLRQLLMILDEPIDIQEAIGGMHSGQQPDSGRVSVDAVRIAREKSKDRETATQIIRKVIVEGLSTPQVKRLSESVAAAPTPQAKEKLLEWEYSPTIHDPDMIKARAETHGAHDPIYRNNKPSPDKEWKDTPEVRMILDGIIEAAKAWATLTSELRRLVGIGKMSPEASQFAAARIRKLGQSLLALADDLQKKVK